MYHLSAPLAFFLLSLWSLLASAAPVQPLTLTATASSLAADSLPASQAVDGNIDTIWSSGAHGSADATEWLRIDFDRTINLAGVTLTPRAGGLGYPQAFRVEYSYDEDGTYWFDVPGAVYTESGRTQPVTYTFGGTIFARRLRLTATTLGLDDYNNAYFQLAEAAPVEGAASMPFSTSQGEAYDAQLAMLWSVYGSLADGSNATFDFGNEPAWYEWVGLKYGWSKTTAVKLSGLRQARIVPWPQSADGYIWSWATQERWPTGNFSYHNENNAKYILGCWRYWSWTRDDTFFSQKDTTATSDAGSRPDVSSGKTIQQKLRLAMQYLEKELQGSAGGITIEDNGMGNDGTTAGEPTNYWDNWRFGYKNAYDNIYYYAALGAMADMEQHWGNTARAAELNARRAGCKTQYNDLFWDGAKGRYIGTIDKNGVRRDYGFTFLNLEALTYGLAPADRAATVLDWISGQRTVSGDRSTGSDIYYWKFAPRANTIAAESTGAPYWWYDLNGAIPVSTAAARWPNHLENGGAIFYTSYYDLMARLAYRGADDALTRLNVILNEFKKDQLRRDPAADGSAAWQLGIIGEFPESGLVPCFLVYGFAGLKPDAAGLHIHPQLPAAWTTFTVRQVAYAGCTLTLTITPTQLTLASAAGGARTLYAGTQALAPGGMLTLSRAAGAETVLTLTPGAAARHWTALE